jgi:hypothetical protein
VTKKLIGSLLWIVPAAALLLAASPTIARADEHIIAAVPFDFIVGNSRLPAGDYVVRESSDTPDVLTIASTDGRQTATILTIPTSPDQRVETPELVFEQFGGQHFLSRVVPGDGDGREIVLTTTIMERELVSTASNAGQ